MGFTERYITRKGVALVTPFHKNNEVDYDSLRR